MLINIVGEPVLTLLYLKLLITAAVESNVRERFAERFLDGAASRKNLRRTLR
jgi:hypothetical protein